MRFTSFKRIVPFFLVFVLSFSSALNFNRKQVYANPILAVEFIPVVYALLASMGVVVAVGATDAVKREAVTDFFTGLTSEQSLSFVDYLKTGTFSSTGPFYSYIPDKTATTAFLPVLSTIVSSYISSLVTYTPSASAYVPYSITSADTDSTLIPLGTAADLPVVVIEDSGFKSVFTILSNGYFLHYKVSDTGAINLISYVFVGSSISLKYYVSYRSSSSTYVNFSVSLSSRPAGFGGVVSMTGSCPSNSTGGFVHGIGSSLRGVGTVDLSALSYSSGVSLGLDELIDCDTLLTSWNKSLVNADADIRIRADADLSNYNNLDSTYDANSGLISGVANPAIPTVPDVPTLTPDVPGISAGVGSILGLLQKLLDMIGSLASSISAAVIGEGSLNFDGLKNSGLSRVFPFCIPYDLVNSFQVFNVPPVKPIFEIDFSGTALSSVGVLTLDLTQFDSIFKIIRYFVYGSFLIGLILSTRKLIKG